ncbi:hypothetical protein LQZ19_05180 [Treponema primitia]|uniref:hypothetical protein n=1 Tax=Treponema primitia TaxID=88058 RepID=UPI00397F5551
MGYEYDSLIFWPKKKIRRTFKEAAAAMGTDMEAAALRVFHERMSLFFVMADETAFSVDNLAVKLYRHARKQLSWAASFPKEEDQGEDDISGIAGEKVEGVPTAPEPVPVMKPFIDGGGHADGINAVNFYPAERVEEVFSRMRSAMGTPREAAELRIFALRMERLYEDAEENHTWIDDGEIFLRVSQHEAAEDAAFVRSITGGVK